MILRNPPMGAECRECGSPSGHNATCSVSIRERNAQIERLRDALTTIAHQADEVARMEVVEKAESRAWKSIAKIARAALVD